MKRSPQIDKLFADATAVKFTDYEFDDAYVGFSARFDGFHVTGFITEDRGE